MRSVVISLVKFHGPQELAGMSMPSGVRADDRRKISYLPELHMLEVVYTPPGGDAVEEWVPRERIQVMRPVRTPKEPAPTLPVSPPQHQVAKPQK